MDRDTEKAIGELERRIKHLEKELKSLRTDKDTDFKTITDWIVKLFNKNNLKL